MNTLDEDWEAFKAMSFGDSLTEQQEAALHMSFAAGATATFRRAQDAGDKKTVRAAVRAFEALQREVGLISAPYALAAALQGQGAGGGETRGQGDQVKGGDDESV